MLSIFARNRMLDKLLNNGDYVIPQLYASVHTENPGLIGSSEISGGFYERQPVNFRNAVDGLAENDKLVKFEGMPSILIKFAGYWDAPVQGNFICGSALENAVRLNSGASLIFPVGKLKIRID